MYALTRSIIVPDFLVFGSRSSENCKRGLQSDSSTRWWHVAVKVRIRWCNEVRVCVVALWSTRLARITSTCLQYEQFECFGPSEPSTAFRVSIVCVVFVISFCFCRLETNSAEEARRCVVLKHLVPVRNTILRFLWRNCRRPDLERWNCGLCVTIYKIAVINSKLWKRIEVC